MKTILCALLVLALTAIPAMAETASDDEPFMTGTVVDASMNVLVIENEIGDRYTFYKDDDTDFSGLANGILLGNRVIVTYSGTIDWDTRDTTAVKVLAVSDAAGGEAAVDGTMIQQMTYVEGEAESTVLERYVNTAAWAAWYDRDTFLVESTRDYPASIVTFRPLDADAIQGVSLKVYLGEADLKEIFGDMYMDPGENEVLVADSDTMHMEAYTIKNETTTLTAVLSCPIEALEGYGSRLKEILNSVSFVDEKGLSALELYLPDQDMNRLVATTVQADDTPQGIVDALHAHGALSSAVGVKSFSIQDDMGALDLDFSFGEIMKNTGTAGEYIYMGSVVNTFLTRYGLSALTVTCEGATIETGHAVYDSPMTFMDNAAQ